MFTPGYSIPLTFLFSDSGTVAFTEFKPRLNTYEQKNKLGNDKVSYEAVGEEVHFKLKSEDYTAL